MIKMKKINLTFLTIAVLFSSLISAQSDKKAEDLVKQVVDKMASYENFKAELSYTMVNKDMDIDEKKTGFIFVKGNSYRVEMEGQIIISDGTTIWTFLVDSQEVMVSNVEEDDESISPTKILTTYNEDYKASYDHDSKYKNSDQKMIILKPNDGKQFEAMSILLNENNLTLESFSVYDKNGNIFTYHIINLESNLDLPADTFRFDESKYPDVEVIDMR